jgi:hypothetical protein
MQKLTFILSVAVLSFSCAVCVGEDPPMTSVRLRFVPGGKAWKGETEFKGASWTRLGSGLRPGELFMQARAGIGDGFPVEDTKGMTLFQIKLLEGDDDRVTVEVKSHSETQKFVLHRDQSSAVSVAGKKYQLLYPSVSVSADPKENPSTNKATLMATSKLQ